MTDVRQDASWRDVDSLTRSQALSLICVPLIAGDRPEGVLYLDSTGRAGAFVRPAPPPARGSRRWHRAGFLRQSLEHRRLEQHNCRLASDIDLDHRLIGDSPPMRELKKLMDRVAPAGTTVLITGERGSGKTSTTGSTSSPSRCRPYAGGPRTSHHSASTSWRSTGASSTGRQEALERSGGVYTQAAQALGLNPNYLHSLATNLGLRRS